MGIPVGDLSSQGTGMEKKCFPQAFVGIPVIFFIMGTGMESYSPAANSPLPSVAQQRSEVRMRREREG
jgi:hypothetical protein